MPGLKDNIYKIMAITSINDAFTPHDMQVIVSQPHFGQVWGVKPNTSKVEDLESFGTPECLELDSKAQNTSR
jgi:hypothetical protein